MYCVLMVNFFFSNLSYKLFEWKRHKVHIKAIE